MGLICWRVLVGRRIVVVNRVSEQSMLLVSHPHVCPFFLLLRLHDCFPVQHHRRNLDGSSSQTPSPSSLRLGSRQRQTTHLAIKLYVWSKTAFLLASSRKE